MGKYYKTGYSSWALLIKETDIVIKAISDFDDFLNDKEKIDYNILPLNSERSKKRVFAEIKRRLKSIYSANLLELYLISNDIDKNLILFYAASKSYKIIPDFMVETVLDKWYNLDYELSSFDFKNFIYKQTDKYPELSELSEKVIINLAGSTIKMLREIGMLNNGKLERREYSTVVLKEIVNNGDSWFLETILLNESERKEIIES